MRPGNPTGPSALGLSDAGSQKPFLRPQFLLLVPPMPSSHPPSTAQATPRPFSSSLKSHAPNSPVQMCLKRTGFL